MADPEPVSIDYNGTLYEKHDGRYIFGTYQIVIAQRDGQGRPTGYRYEEKGEYGGRGIWGTLLTNRTLSGMQFGSE